MKTKQLITLFILITCFALLREVEKKVSYQAKAVIEQLSAGVGINSEEENNQFAQLTTHIKNW